METDQLASLPNTGPNDVANFMVQEYERQQTVGSPFIRLPGSEKPEEEDLDWTTWAHITSYESLPGAFMMDLVGNMSFPQIDAGFEGNEWIRQNYKDWKDRPEIVTAINQGWFDDANSPEHAQYNLNLAMGVNDVLAEAHKMSWTEMGMTMGWQLGGDPANLLMGMGLAKAGYKGVTALKLLNTPGALGAAKTVTAGAVAGGVGNLAYEEILKDLNPGTNYDPFGNQQELMAFGMGAAFGGGLTALGRAMRAAPGVPGVGAAMDRFRMERLNRALDTIEAEESFTLRDGRKGTFSVAAKESDNDLDFILDGAALEGVHTVSPLIPRELRKGMNKKLTALQKKADTEGWTLQVLRHPEQDVMDTFDLGQDIINSPAMNRIAKKTQLDAGKVDRGISAVTNTYAKMQSIVTPGGRTAGRQLTVIEDMYRTLSGSAHTVTQASAVNPLNRQVGVTAEGYAAQLHKQSEQLNAKFIRIHRQARRDTKGTGINYDGGFVPASLTKGQVQFEEAVSDYIRRKHASEMGYDVEVPTDVHPSIKEAATESEKYFTRMGDELVKTGILDADNALLGQYLPVVFDHRAVRRNQQGFVDDLVRAFEEKDLQGLTRGLDDLDVDEALVREMNVRAGRDLFADEAPAPTRAEAVEPEPAPVPTNPIDTRARQELDDISQKIEADPEGRPMDTPDQPAAPDRAWDDFDSGEFTGNTVAGRLGDEAIVFLPDGKSMQARWALVDAVDMIPSHSATRGMNARGGYPQNRNADLNLGRGYSDPKLGAGPIALVKKIGENPNIDLLVNTSVDAMNGPSVVTKHGQVLGGNARMMGTQVIYQKGGANAAKFQAKTIKLAKTLGIDDADGISNPVLVRVAYEPGARGQMSEILNRPASTG